MAVLTNLTIDDTGFVRLPNGTGANRPASPTGSQLRFNTQTNRIEIWNGTVWTSEGVVGTGLSQNDPAESGLALAAAYPDFPSGYYWIKSPAMPNALQMYVDMTEEGGGFDFYPIQNGTNVWTVFANPNGSNSPAHSGIALGLDFWYPRSKYHWRAATNFVRNVLGETGSNYQRYFRVAGPVYRTNSTDSGSGDGGNYTSQIMRDPRYYGSGVPNWRVPDGGRWWFRDTTFSEPNGDYLNYGFLAISGGRVTWNTGAVVSSSGSYTVPEPYALEDLSFNDIGSNRHHNTGTYYLVSTNAKP